MWKQKKMVGLLGVGMMLLPQLALGKTVGSVNADVLNVRLEPTTTSAIVKKVYAKEVVQIMDLVGGEIYLDCTYQKGARFIVEWPTK